MSKTGGENGPRGGLGGDRSAFVTEFGSVDIAEPGKFVSVMLDRLLPVSVSCRARAFRSRLAAWSCRYKECIREVALCWSGTASFDGEGDSDFCCEVLVLVWRC